MKMALLFVAGVLCCADRTSAKQISLTSRGSFELHTTQAETVIYRGRHALKLTEKPVGSGQLLAILRGHPFRPRILSANKMNSANFAPGCPETRRASPDHPNPHDSPSDFLMNSPSD